MPPGAWHAPAVSVRPQNGPDLARLRSGQFATNDLALPLAVPAFNILRDIGQPP